MSNTIADAVIVGAGPACVAAALRLLHAGKRVIVLERGPEKAAKLPETVLPFRSVSPELLQLVDTAADGAKLPFDVCFHGTAARHQLRMQFVAAPGEPEPFLWIDRAKFDTALRQALAAAGAEVLYTRTVTRVELPEDTAEPVTIRHTGPGGDEAVVQAQLIVDASGKMSVLRNQLKLEAPGHVLDNRAGFFTHFIVSESQHALLPATVNILPLRTGFIYAIWLDETRISVGATLFEACPSGDEAFKAALNQVPWLADALACARRVLPVIPVQNREWQAVELASARYLLTGDAGGFTDPFFCNGIRAALETGELAGDAAVEMLDNPRLAGRIAARYTNQYRVAVAAAKDSMVDSLAEAIPAFRSFHLTDPHIPYPVSASLMGFLQPGAADPAARMLSIRTPGEQRACASTI